MFKNAEFAKMAKMTKMAEKAIFTKSAGREQTAREAEMTRLARTA